MARATYLVAGAGVAGIEAAAAIRTADSRGRILVVGEDPHPFYARIRIGELVDGRVAIERLILRKADWYAQRDMEVRTAVRLEGLEPRERLATLSDGSRVTYDGLLLATGSRPFMPPIPGNDLQGVTTMRTIDDALRLKALAAEAGSAVVVGGGLLGLEAAVSLKNAGLDVTVVDISPWLLSRQLDPDGGGLVQEILERRGLMFRTGIGVESFTGNGRVESVLLADGTALPADLVLVAAGVRAETSLARESGITVNQGIVVNDSLATSAPGVYAAGDCAEHGGRLYGIWPASEAQGKAAGAAMAGVKTNYDGTIPLNTLKVADVAVFSMGDMDPEESGDAETTRDGDTYRRLTRDGKGRLVGAVLIGSLKERRGIVKAIKEGSPYTPDAG